MVELTLFPSTNTDIQEPDWDSMMADPADRTNARELWRQTIAEMRNAQTLAPINVQEIKRYIVAMLAYDKAAKAVLEKGPVYQGKQNGSTNYSPYWTVLKDCDALATNHEEKLGLNPRRRAQVSAAKKAKKEGGADKFLGGT